MTKELIEKARESANKNHRIPSNWNEIDIAGQDGYIKGYIAGVEEVTKELQEQIEKILNEVDKYMCLSNMKEREIYDIQEIFRQNGFKRNSADKWELGE